MLREAMNNPPETFAEAYAVMLRAEFCDRRYTPPEAMMRMPPDSIQWETPRGRITWFRDGRVEDERQKESA